MFESYLGGPKLIVGEKVAALGEKPAPNPPEIICQSSLTWAEHCTECAMPGCYSSCEFYTPRQDLHCQRFYNNIELLRTEGETDTWFAVKFRKWANLQAAGPVSLHTRLTVDLVEQADRFVSRLISKLPLRYGFSNRLANYWTKKKPIVLGVIGGMPLSAATHFLADIFNPQTEVVTLILTIRSKSDPKIFLSHRMVLEPGHNRQAIDVASFVRQFDRKNEFWVSLTCDGDSFGHELFFRFLDFMKLRNVEDIYDSRTVARAPAKRANEAADPVFSAPAPASKPKTAKCVVWDLDNTLWDGVLIEDGLDGITIREEIVNIIMNLDRRGIINSVASKNHPGDALAALEHFRLTDLFVYPQVSWDPKSVSVSKIHQALNIGVDTFIFIDDQPFERAEVSAAHSEITVLTETEVLGLLDHPMCNVPVTEESRNRRSFYQDQITREGVIGEFAGDYQTFLRYCEIKVFLEPLSPSTMPRVHELTQRTNQMNFSGNRYTKVRLREIAANGTKDTFVISCEDRFGHYGIIGFGIVERTSWTLADLMFSCRIQSKKVEHAFICHIAEIARKSGTTTLKALYKKTERNTPSGQVFYDLGFKEKGQRNGVLDLALDLESPPRLIDTVTIMHRHTEASHVE